MKVVDDGEETSYCGSTMQRTRLFGTYEHSVDDKGRITLPAEFREHFAEGVVLVRLPIQPNCVMVFSKADWEVYERRYIDRLNTFDDYEGDWESREIHSRMSQCKPDRQWRVSLTQGKVAEGLDLSGKVTIIGNRDRLEIWNPVTLAEENEKYRRRKAAKEAAGEQTHDS